MLSSQVLEIATSICIGKLHLTPSISLFQLDISNNKATGVFVSQLFPADVEVLLIPDVAQCYIAKVGLISTEEKK